MKQLDKDSKSQKIGFYFNSYFIKKTLFIITFLFSFISYSQNVRTIKTSEYEISFPENLKFDDSKTRNTEVIIYMENEKDLFIENINLLIQDLKGHQIDLNQYVKITETQVNENGKLIESEKINLNGASAQLMVYEATLSGRALKFYQYILVKNEKAFVLTYSAEVENFELYFQEMNKIFNSFTAK